MKEEERGEKLQTKRKLEGNKQRERTSVNLADGGGRGVGEPADLKERGSKASEDGSFLSVENYRMKRIKTLL